MISQEKLLSKKTSKMRHSYCPTSKQVFKIKKKRNWNLTWTICGGLLFTAAAVVDVAAPSSSFWHISSHFGSHFSTQLGYERALVHDFWQASRHDALQFPIPVDLSKTTTSGGGSWFSSTQDGVHWGWQTSGQDCCSHAVWQVSWHVS